MRRLLTGLALSLCLGAPVPAFTPDPGGPVLAHVIPMTDPVPAPQAAFRGPGTGNLRLTDWRGQVVIATIWATWCEVCHEEMPVLDRMAAARDDLVVLPVSVDQVDPFRSIRRYYDRAGLTSLPVYSDRDTTLAAQIGVRVTPTTIILDRFGQVVAAIEGRAPWESAEMRAYLAALIAAETPEAARGLLAAR